MRRLPRGPQAGASHRPSCRPERALEPPRARCSARAQADDHGCTGERELVAELRHRSPGRRTPVSSSDRRERSRETRPGAPGRRVGFEGRATRLLDRAIDVSGKPDGASWTTPSNSLRGPGRRGIALARIEPGRPVANARAKGFDARVRDRARTSTSSRHSTARGTGSSRDDEEHVGRAPPTADRRAACASSSVGRRPWPRTRTPHATANGL